MVEISGTRNGVPWPPRGNSLDLPDDEARELINQQMAIPDGIRGDVETATLPSLGVEVRTPPVADERPLTTKTGPAPARKGAQR
jgi:hypothetical protein